MHTKTCKIDFSCSVCCICYKDFVILQVEIDAVCTLSKIKQISYMKLIKHFSILLCVAALAVACEMAIPPFGPIDRPDNGELPPPVEAPDTIGWNIPAEAITVAQAREICMGLESEAKTDTKYYVMGYVKKIHSKHADGVANFGNAQFYMEDVKGANSGDDFMAYQVYGINNQKITDPNAVLVGDFVIIYGPLTNYNGTFETTGQGSAHIWKSTNPLMVAPKPEPEEVVIFEKDLSNKTAIDTFTIKDFGGAETWKYKRATTNMRTEINGINNEDWLITPVLDLTNMSEASLNFEYKFSDTIPVEYQYQYTVVISKDYDGNPDNVKSATWIELTGFSYETTKYAESGVISFPAEMIGSKCYIAWKYHTAETSHTWALKNVIVKALTKVE